jgi:DNA-binding LytR/AlgR family response regulator
MEENETPKTYGKIIFPGYTQNVIEDTNDIAYIMADDNYIQIKFKNKNRNKMTQAVCLCYAEDRLDPAKFSRCHDKYIVAGNYVDKKRRNNRGLIITLLNEEEIPVSWRKKDQFLKFMRPFRPNWFSSH